MSSAEPVSYTHLILRINSALLYKFGDSTGAAVYNDESSTVEASFCMFPYLEERTFVDNYGLVRIEGKNLWGTAPIRLHDKGMIWVGTDISEVTLHVVPSSAEAGTVVATYDDDSLVKESSFQYDPELVQTNPEGLQFIKEDGKVVLGIKTGVTLTPSETEIFFDGQPHGFDGTVKVTDSHGSVITQTLSDVDVYKRQPPRGVGPSAQFSGI